MLQKSSLILLGVLVGWVLTLSQPIGAHHNPEVKKLKKRVAELEFKLDIGERSCGFRNAVTWYSEGAVFERFQCNNFTATQIEVPSGCTNDPAIWSASGLDC